MNTNTESYTLGIAYEEGPSDGFPSYRFSRFPRIGEVVCGQKYVYSVTEIQHCNGLAIDAEPYVTVVLKHIGSTQ